MLSKSLIAMSVALFVGMAQGITISWNIPHGHPSYTWQKEITGMAILTTSDINNLSSPQSVIDAYNSNTVTMVQGTTFETSFDRSSIDMTDANLVANNYYFLALKNASGEYVISKAHQYLPEMDPKTGNLSDSKHGFYYDTVGNKNKPDGADYVDLPGILGGTWKAAMTPEPTVLALLALGVAGFVLRRKDTTL